MKNPKKSEKLFLERVLRASLELKHCQRELGIGEMIVLIRGQLKMSQRVLAMKANVPQSTISKIESGVVQPNVATLCNILEAMECDLLVSVVPRKNLECILKDQAMLKAKEKVQYLQGTMSLEEQNVDQDLLEELIEDEVKKLMDSSSQEIWEE